MQAGLRLHCSHATKSDFLTAINEQIIYEQLFSCTKTHLQTVTPEDLPVFATSDNYKEQTIKADLIKTDIYHVIHCTDDIAPLLQTV